MWEHWRANAVSQSLIENTFSFLPEVHHVFSSVILSFKFPAIRWVHPNSSAEMDERAWAVFIDLRI